MFEELRSWVVSTADSSPIVFVQIQPPSEGTGWLDFLIPLLSAIVGGALAIWGSHIATSRDLKNQRAKEKAAQAGLAVSGYLKLVGWTNLVEDIDAHVTEALQAAQEEGIETTDVSQMVGPSIGKLYEPETFHADEISFLLTSENTSILNDIQLLSQRAANLHDLLKRYSEERFAFGAWFSEVSTNKKLVSGVTSEACVSKQYKGQYDEKVSHLNAIVGNIVEMADRDKPLAYKACSDFVDAARKHFGEAFPPLSVGPIRTEKYVSGK